MRGSAWGPRTALGVHGEGKGAVSPIPARGPKGGGGWGGVSTGGPSAAPLGGGSRSPPGRGAQCGAVCRLSAAPLGCRGGCRVTRTPRPYNRPRVAQPLEGIQQEGGVAIGRCPPPPPPSPGPALRLYRVTRGGWGDTHRLAGRQHPTAGRTQMRVLNPLPNPFGSACGPEIAAGIACPGVGNVGTTPPPPQPPHSPKSYGLRLQGRAGSP